MTNHFDYYAILGVGTNASFEQIQEAFAVMRSSFPEHARDPDTNSEYQRVLNAFEVLNDPQRRSIYDSLLVETAPATIDITIQASRKKISLADTQQMVYLLVNVNPPAQEADKQLPLNLCLVIDRSTSMQGTRLRHVKTAVELIIDKLSEEDVLSVVSFSDRAQLVVPAEPVLNKNLISSKVRSIAPSGGTEIYQGLHAGYKEMIQLPLQKYTNHLILLTDGHTYGDADQCLELAGRAAIKGIGFSAFGIGSEWNDQFLDKLVSVSGGQSGFIENPEQVIQHLQKRIKGLGHLFAQNMQLDKNFPPSITIKNAFKLKPFAQPLDMSQDVFKLGDIEGRKPLTFLLEILIDPQPITTRINVPLAFTATIPSQQNQNRTFKETFQIIAIENAAKVPPPEEVVEAVRMLNMIQLNDKVQEELEAGRLDVAGTRMRYLTTRLLEAGETQLAHQAHAEAERITHMGTMSLEGQKKLKYGTRALIDQTISLDNDD